MGSNRGIEAVVDRNSKKNGHIGAGKSLLLGLLLLAIAINLVPFHFSGVQTRLTGYPAIIKLSNLGIRGKERIVHHMGLYLALGEKAPKVDLLLPEGCALDVAKLYGLGRARNISYEDYDPEAVFTEFDFSGHVVASFDADKRFGPGPFAIAIGEGSPETMMALKRNDTWYIVDISVLPSKNS